MNIFKKKVINLNKNTPHKSQLVKVYYLVNTLSTNLKILDTVN